MADDWLVADSEDEDIFPPLQPVYSSGASAIHPPVTVPAINLASSEIVQTATFTPDQPRTPEQGRRSPSTFANASLFTPPLGGLDSTINDFSSAAPTSVAPSEMAPMPRPRPRPRVVIKRPATLDQNAVASVPFSHISDPPVSVTKQTNDSIQPATSTSFAASEVTDDIYSSFDIAERAKMRSRKSQKAKDPVPPSNQMKEIIELTSDDEDELILKPPKRRKKQGDLVPTPNVPSKPRPKPRLKVKRTAVLPSDSPPSENTRHGPQAPSALDTSSSQFPTSTLPTIPPSTPSQAREPTPLSSPVITRKRKRARPSVAVDEDEMTITGEGPVGASPSIAEPPPFFAPSSSSLPADSGIEIPPAESLSARGKKKQVSSRKGTLGKTQNKGKKGKKVGTTSAAVEMEEEPASVNQGASIPAMYQSSNFADDGHSPVAKQSTASKKASGRKPVTKKGKSRVIDSDEEEDELALPSKSDTFHVPHEGEGQIRKENLQPSPPKNYSPERTPAPAARFRNPSIKPKPTPMSELIRRVNSQPNSPFPNARTYSPLLKSSRTMLSKIAPLHPNRRTPPPPLPRPPPPKKSKKQLEMEERIEEELAETVEGWSCLTDEERKALRRARIDAELGYE